MAEAVSSCHSIDEWKVQLEESTKSNKPIVIDFTASWCPPCRFIAPIFFDLAKKYSNVIFVKIDVDELKAVATEFNVEAMPTFVFVKDGKEIENSRVVGADKEKLESQIKLLAEQKI